LHTATAAHPHLTNDLIPASNSLPKLTYKTVRSLQFILVSGEIKLLRVWIHRPYLSVFFIRLPDLVVGGLMFYRDSSSFSSSSILFFVSYPELGERNSTKTGHMLENECDLKMLVRNLRYPLPLQIGGPKTPFSTTSQLNGNFNGLYLRNKKRDIIGQVRWNLRWVS